MPQARERATRALPVVILAWRSKTLAKSTAIDADSGKQMYEGLGSPPPERQKSVA